MENIIKIGVFYDGNYLIEVSKYYKFHHARKRWINIEGLHAFVRHAVADIMESKEKFCRIIDAHFFRGRYYAKECSDEQLRRDRIFDDSLMQHGITAHYAPLGSYGRN